MGKGSLYLRPLLIGTGPILGLGPAPSYTFTVFCAAVGAYFKVWRGENAERERERGRRASVRKGARGRGWREGEMWGAGRE